ncbi:MAG TPA: alpha/beta hydrolase [Polyangiaceae bacterium]|nr:alpha/beta hydrolase [Polyangiaceae bacterium]
MNRSVGCLVGAIPDPTQGVELPAWFLYPSHAIERIEHFGPYPFSAALGGPPVGSGWPLVAISHGNNGSPWTHRETARALVHAGYAVVMVEHLGNSRSDASLANTSHNLTNRPRHLRLALDWATLHCEHREHVSTTDVFGLGHSIGAYTILASAGGEPSMSHGPGRIGPRVPVEHDARLRALVLLAPAAPWFIPEGSLENVELPMLLWRGELDSLAPEFHSEVILRGVRRRELVDYRVASGAGHFSFQSPFPASMVSREFPPSQDPEGFDRAGFQSALNREIVAFLERQRRPRP